MPTKSRRRGIAALSILLLAMALAPAVRASAPTPKPRVLLFGDSLAWEAQGAFRTFADAHGLDARTYVAGGTAICDFRREMDDAAPTHPEVVVVAFSGNSITPCLRGGDGRQYWGETLFDKYNADIALTMATFPGSAVFFVGAPPPASALPNDRQVADLYRAAAATYPNAHFVDGGALITPGGVWSRTQPCLAFEPCLGPLLGIGHVNVVRAPDGGHFCPVAEPAVLGVVQPCPVYSSGAVRYALSMIGPVAAALRA